MLKKQSKYKFETTPERSLRMSNIRSTNTRYEIVLRKALWATGIRYRLNVKTLPGKPDIVIGKHKLVIFVDGEFWHGFNWEEKKLRIKANKNYWVPKIERNMQRDLENMAALEALGYTVLRFWEQDIRKDLNTCISKVKGIIFGNKLLISIVVLFIFRPRYNHKLVV
jgi:DNA mismatch endonuclease (patch repair protein)